MRVHAILTSGAALCASRGGDGELRAVESYLLDQPPCAGDWLLVHVGLAVRAIEPEEAQQIGDALQAVAAAAAGETFEHLIADLIDREPELPAHLREQAVGDAERG